MVEMLRTARLVVRPLRDADLDAVADMHADPRVVAYLHAPLSRAESAELLARLRASAARDGVGLSAVELLEDGTFVGLVGLARPRPEIPLAPCVEISWRIASAHWGRGYATEAAQACLDYGFGHLDLPEILAWTSRPNVASQRVMERLGMVRDPDADFDHPRLAHDNPLRRHLVWRLPRPT